MYEILSINDVCISHDQRGWFATIEAYIADMVVVHPATLVDPAEMGPALCIGTLILDDPVAFKLLFLNPIEADEQMSLAEEVDNWIISTGY